MAANRAGDAAAALAASQRLAPLLAHIDDPYLRALSRLAIGWTSMTAGDSDDAIRQESVSLEEFRGQDEPYWTATAALSVGSLQAAIGRDDDAARSLSQARELADQFSYHWPAAWSRVQMGTLGAFAAGLTRPGTCWMRRWTSAWPPAAPRWWPCAWPRTPGWRSDKVTWNGPHC